MANEWKPIILLILLIFAVAILTSDHISYDNDIKTDSIKTQLTAEQRVYLYAMCAWALEMVEWNLCLFIKEQIWRDGERDVVCGCETIAYE